MKEGLSLSLSHSLFLPSSLLIFLFISDASTQQPLLCLSCGLCHHASTAAVTSLLCLRSHE